MRPNQFIIYEKPEEVPHTERVLYLVSVLVVASTFLGLYFAEIAELDMLLLFSMFFFLVFALLMRFFLPKRPESKKALKYLAFFKDRICIDTEVYALEDALKIEFSTTDYYDKSTFSTFNYYARRRSTGVDNYCSIHLKDGTTVKTFFQIKEKNGILAVEEEILTYYKLDKISTLNTSEVMGLNTYEEIQKLKALKNQPN